MRTADFFAEAYFLGYPAGTRNAYRGDLASWLTWCERYDVDPRIARASHLELWCEDRKDTGFADSSIRRGLSAVSGFYEHLRRDDVWTGINPVLAVRRPTGEREAYPAFTMEELLRILEAARVTGDRDYSIVYALGVSGLRSTDAATQAGYGDRSAVKLALRRVGAEVGLHLTGEGLRKNARCARWAGL